MNSFFYILKKLLIPFVLLWVLVNICYEFYGIAWGTGLWRGEFSLSWGLAFYLVVFFSVIFWAGAAYLSVYPDKFQRLGKVTLNLRYQLGSLRWVFYILIFLLPLLLFSYSIWGVVFQKLYIRLFIWFGITTLLTFLSSPKEYLFDIRFFLVSLLLTASAFSTFAYIGRVSDYPFSLGWSEGNRMWDYSVLFGRDLYIYPQGRKIPALIDLGRQLIGGLPFLLPNVSIVQERFWIGLTRVLPYLFLGIASFYPMKGKKISWLLPALWTFLFLKQGPIHPPLTISAVFVVLAWRSSNWLAIPFIIIAGYITQASRFTWVFAPAIWIALLVFVSASFSDFKSAMPAIKRATLLFIFALFGSFALSAFISSSQGIFDFSESTITSIETEVPPTNQVVETPAPATPSSAQEVPDSFIELILYAITVQPLLWYRLLPNSTYKQGILLGLLIAVLPLLIILYYLIREKIWKLSKVKIAVILLPLLAFLLVGLVASVKIGGGGDLHNMDMFLITILFISALAWHMGGLNWLENLSNTQTPLLIKGLLIFMISISSVGSMMELRSYAYGEKTAWLKIVTDAPSEASLSMLPAQETVDQSLEVIKQEILNAKPEEILFIDQRQLLTFGYISDVPLIAEYEKKILMNEALSDSSKYFSNFYKDLQNKRFGLIISEPLKTPKQDSTDRFGEENNAWVKWVSIPILCYYDIKTTLREVNVQLLVPKPEVVDCSAELPTVTP